MSDAPTTPATSGFAGLPRWLRLSLIAAATAVALLVLAVVVRVTLQSPIIPLVVTPVDKLIPGSCLQEPGDADTYTVVACVTPHQQQMIAEVDLDFPGVDYTADSALAEYAMQACDRLLEYKLFLVPELVKSDFAMAAIGVPTLAEYQAGHTTTRCAVLDNPDVPDKGGTSVDLTVDLYKAIPS